MKCPNCNKEIANDSKFCEFCGAKIESGLRLSKRLLFLIIAGIALAIGIIIGVLSVGNKIVVYADAESEFIDSVVVSESGLPSDTWCNDSGTKTDETDKKAPKKFEVGSFYNLNGKKGIVCKVSGDKLHGQYFTIEKMHTWNESYKMAEEAGGRLASYEDMKLIGRNFDLLDDAAKKNLPYSLSQLGAVWISDASEHSIYFNKEDEIEGGYPGGIGEFELLNPVFVFEF